MGNRYTQCLLALLVFFLGAPLLAQPGSIVTQSKTVVTDEIAPEVVDEFVIDQVVGSRVMNTLELRICPQ